MPKVVVDQFKGLQQIQIFHGIWLENIWNFNETGARNSCSLSIQVWVPTSIKEVFYSYLQASSIIQKLIDFKMFFNSLENQKSITIIKAISTTRQTIAHYIILTSKRRMQNQLNLEFRPTTVLNMSDKGFTNNRINMQWLRHFIQETNSGLTAVKKLLLYNGDSSHNTNKFKQLAEDNIVLYMFPPHITHLIQLLDI